MNKRSYKQLITTSMYPSFKLSGFYKNTNFSTIKATKTWMYGYVMFVLINIFSIKLASGQIVSDSVTNTEFSIVNADFLLATEKKVAIDDLLVIEDIYPDLALDNRKPLFLIHGWNFEGEPAPPGGSLWENFKNFFIADSELRNYFKPYLVKYWSNAVTVNELAAELRKKIELAGLHEQKIILLAHSMGGLVSRSYMNEQFFNNGKQKGKKCGELVDLLITLSSPHHGSPMANGPARDAKVNFLLKLTMSTLDAMVFSETKYNEVNRGDLRWDNYDNLLDYVKYPSERNQWLENLNANTQFNSKIVLYTAAVEGEFVIPEEGNVTQAYKLGSYLMTQSFGFANDGIVPVKSSGFDRQIVKRIRHFTNYNHAEIIMGKSNRDELFGPIKSDLMEVAPVQLLWPTAQNEFVKYGQYKKIKWNAPAAVSTVNLYYSNNNGETYTLIAGNLPATLGEYNWLVPDINSSKCLIKVTNFSNETESDVSTFPFTIYHNTINNIQPIIDPYFVKGRLNKIQWNQSGLGTNVRISYIDQAKGIQVVITENTPTVAGVNTIDWVVDQSIAPSATGLIRIQMLNMNELYGDSESYVFSSTPFSVLGSASIAVQSPSGYPIDFEGIGGEQLEIGKSYRISWQTQGEIKNFQLLLCDSLKKPIKTIIQQTTVPSFTTNGYYDWKVDEFYGDKFYFIIKGGSDAQNFIVSDTSDYSFRINRMPSVVSPMPGNESVKLLPVLEMNKIENAGLYEWTFTDSSLNSKKFSSIENKFSVPNKAQNELVVGMDYTVVAKVLIGGNYSYGKQFSIKAEQVKPYSFSLISPIRDAAVEITKNDATTAKVTLSWERSVGALGYELIVQQLDKSYKTYTGFSNTDTVFNAEIAGFEYNLPILWEVVAVNDIGQTKAQSTFNKVFKTDFNQYTNPTGYSISIFPNPFDRETQFEVVVPDKFNGERVKIEIFDLSGRAVAKVFDDVLPSGTQYCTWNSKTANGESAKPGIYLCGITTTAGTSFLKIIKQ